jgi:Zn-dependent M28 family amino/carboxypeptidase
VAVLVAGLLVFAADPEIPKSPFIDSAGLLADLKALSHDNMQGRRTATAGAAKARAFIVKRFKASGIAPFGASYESSFAVRNSRGGLAEGRGVNVLGRIKGKRRPDHYIVVSAHYDHVGTQNGVIFNGADDNASGTAALFAIAKYFKRHAPTNSLLFAAFDAEEIGRQGSQALVTRPPVDLRLITLNLNMDMIGREPDKRLFVVGTVLHPFLKPYIESVARKAPVRLLVGHEDPAQPEDWTRDSDHFSFIQARVPALYFGVEDFDQHHQPTDDYETMTYEFYVRAIETIIQVIEQFDVNLDNIEKARAALALNA